MKTLKDLETIKNKIKTLEKELDELHENAKRRAIKEAEKEGIIINSYCFNDKEREKEMEIKEKLSILRKERDKVFKELKANGIIPRR